MSLQDCGYIVGAYEHPTCKADSLSVMRLHADVTIGALKDAGLSKDDIDGYFCVGEMPGLGHGLDGEYLNLRVRHVDSTESGGSAPIFHVAHALQAIAAAIATTPSETLRSNGGDPQIDKTKKGLRGGGL